MTDLPRREPLRRTPMPPRKTPMSRGSSRLARTPMRRQRPTVTREEVNARRLVRWRSGGVCERCGRARATNFHHRKAEGQGGLYCPSNGLDLCGSGTTGCHGEVTVNPRVSYERGWSVRSGHDPASQRVWLAHRGWALLLPDGCIRLLTDPD